MPCNLYINYACPQALHQPASDQDKIWYREVSGTGVRVPASFQISRDDILIWCKEDMPAQKVNHMDYCGSCWMKQDMSEEQAWMHGDGTEPCRLATRKKEKGAILHVTAQLVRVNGNCGMSTIYDSETDTRTNGTSKPLDLHWGYI